MSSRSIAYGQHRSQVADWYPAVDPAAPLVVLLHGGFWREPYDRAESGANIPELGDRGFGVLNVEYRRVGDGGGWPVTGEDVLAALGLLPTLGISPGTVTLAGFSAGGHLALWGAAEWVRRGRPGLKIDRVVALAPVSDLRLGAELGLGNDAVQSFLGGEPGEVPDRYREASPAERLPVGVPQVVVHGDQDGAVPLDMSRRYCELARAAGDDVSLVVVEGGGHLDFLDPRSKAFRSIGWT